HTGFFLGACPSGCPSASLRFRRHSPGAWNRCVSFCHRAFGRMLSGRGTHRALGGANLSGGGNRTSSNDLIAAFLLGPLGPRARSPSRGVPLGAPPTVTPR